MTTLKAKPFGLLCVLALLAVMGASVASSIQGVRIAPRAGVTPHPTTAVEVDFDYFVYTLTWPGTFCEEHRCEKDPTYFTVHGLWPNYENGKWPAFCNSSYPFNEDEIEDILPTMEKIWPDVKSSNPDGTWLWSHEWSKHGTCAKPVLNGEHDYFSKALELYSDLNPTDVLEEHNFVPSPSAYYALDDINDLMAKTFGKSVNIGCQNGGLDLYQIEFCLQKDFQLRDCAEARDCKDRIRIPPPPGRRAQNSIKENVRRF